ncbi:MAG: hypothetical protein ACXWJE_10130 [Burkholderiaceae bacterium]
MSLRKDGLLIYEQCCSQTVCIASGFARGVDWIIWQFGDLGVAMIEKSL